MTRLLAVFASTFVLTGCPFGSSADNSDGSNPAPGEITAKVLLANNYGLQLHPLYRSDFGAGSATSRMKLFVRFCSDPACAEPIALGDVEVDGVDAEGRYLFATASGTGAGVSEKSVRIKAVPAGAAYFQLIGDTQLGDERGYGKCTSTSDCPGDLDVLQQQGFNTAANSDGTLDQPGSGTTAVPAGGGDVGTLYLGHFNFDIAALRVKAPADAGKLVVALSNATDTYRNRIAVVDLDDATSHPGVMESSYVLQQGSADYAGDVCGLIRAGASLFALTYSNAGGHVFRLNAATGAQSANTPIVTIPPGSNDAFPHACRGVYASVGGKEHLYLIEFAGAGSLPTSLPHPVYDVNLTDGTVAYPDVDATMAIRSIAYFPGKVIVADMSWSQYAGNNPPEKIRLLQIAVDGSGALAAAPASTTVTTFAGDDNCDASVQWPTGIGAVQIGGALRLVVGHDTGVAVFDPVALAAPLSNLELPAFGRLFSQFSVANGKLYALPQCKAITANSPFTLPYGAGTEGSDSYRVALLDVSGASLTVAATQIDVDGDGEKEDGIDLDYFHLKQFIRQHGTTLPIPPVVYTGPQMVVGQNMLFIRGSGIQGNGGNTLSSSGLGQVQEVGFFDLSTGRGLLFGGYVPWINGLSAGGGTAKAIWGYDLVPGKEGSIGAIEYLP